MKTALVCVTTFGLCAAAFGTQPYTVNNGALTMVDRVVEVPTSGLVNPASCDLIFETFNDTFLPVYTSGWTIGLDGTDQEIANPFTLNEDSTLCEISVVAGHVLGDNLYIVSVHEDGGTVPGAILFDYQIADLGAFGDPNPETVVDASNAQLDAGQWWVSLRRANAGTWGALCLSTDPAYQSVPWAFRANQGAWTATQGQSGAWRVTAEAGGGGLDLAFSGNCPGTGTFDVTGATPNGNVALVYGFGDGPTTIPSTFPCAGTVLNVGNPNLDNRVVSADANGNATLSTFVPGAACGAVNVQALDVTTCAVSNVVTP